MHLLHDLGKAQWKWKEGQIKVFTSSIIEEYF